MADFAIPNVRFAATIAAHSPTLGEHETAQIGALAMTLMDRATIQSHVETAVTEQQVTDMHTHVFAPGFGCSPEPNGLMLWGIDELVTYHYLVAEVFRVAPPTEMPFDRFWAMSKSEQADHIWQKLFVENSPVSEACRGVVTTLSKLGLDPNEKHLDGYRDWYRQFYSGWNGEGASCS